MLFKKKENNNNNDKREKRKFKDTVNKKYLKNGSYSSVMIVVFVAIIIVINMIVGNLPSKYTQLDISAEKLYTIGDETKAMLKDLNKDVTIYQIAQSGSEDETISNLLQRYADESDHITVEVKDPVVNPKFVSEYTTDNLSSNSLIVVCGDRNKVVNYNNIYQSELDYNTYSYNTTGFDGEGQITSAIAYVTSEDLPILYTLEGHGEQELDSTIKEDVEKANMDIKSLNLLTEGSVPEDASCLLIDSPTSDFSDDEKDAIITYLENGGKAMILMPYAQGIQKIDDVRDTVNIESLLTTSDSAYSKTDMSSGTLEKEDGDVEGPFDLGVSITESVEDGKETHIIYFSTANLLQGEVNQMVSGGNEKLVMAAFSSLVDSETTTTVSIPSKSLEVSYLTLTAYDASFWKICVIGLIPGAFLVIGFMIWLKRRKA